MAPTPRAAFAAPDGSPPRPAPPGGASGRSAARAARTVVLTAAVAAVSTQAAAAEHGGALRCETPEAGSGFVLTLDFAARAAVAVFDTDPVLRPEPYALAWDPAVLRLTARNGGRPALLVVHRATGRAAWLDAPPNRPPYTCRPAEPGR